MTNRGFLLVIILLCLINVVFSRRIGILIENKANSSVKYELSTTQSTNSVSTLSPEKSTAKDDVVSTTADSSGTAESSGAADSSGTAESSGTDVCGECNSTACSRPTEPCGDVGKTWDDCGCCPTCYNRNEEDKCSTITCPRWKVCVLNIQGIPICRCPSKLSCPKHPVKPIKRLCGSDDNTYKTRCLLRVQQCAIQRKIRVKHKGPCVKSEKDRKLHEKMKEKLAKKTKRRARKEERRRKRLRRRKLKRLYRMGSRRRRRMN